MKYFDQAQDDPKESLKSAGPCILMVTPTTTLRWIKYLESKDEVPSSLEAPVFRIPLI